MKKITDEELRKFRGPNQIFYEWKIFLQFLQVYFTSKKIEHPLVVEIGTQFGRQKKFYETFLDAIHIGIDMSPRDSTPEILGNSHDPETMKKLVEMLDGRAVNLVFIDATHVYKDALQDYDAFGPLSTDIIAMHDIRHVNEIGKLWQDIQIRDRDEYNKSFFSIGNFGGGWCELGIGIVVKHTRTDLKAILDGFRAERLDG